VTSTTLNKTGMVRVEINRKGFLMIFKRRIIKGEENGKQKTKEEWKFEYSKKGQPGYSACNPSFLGRQR
jgi:hypothetical protein